MTGTGTAASAAGAPTAAEAPAAHAAPFASVLCGVGAGIPSLDAARHAGVLAAGGRLTLVAIGGTDGVGPEWAELAAAFVLAGRDGEPADVLEVPADRVLPSLLLLAGRHDLLVIGAHDAGSGRADITGTIVHQSPVPVLVARPVASGATVADRLLAVGDPEGAAPASAAAIAARHGSLVQTLPPPGEGAGARDRDARAVTDAAARFGATLIVISSRGLAGIAALESVSAAVAARAACSVLVLRPT